MEESILTSIKKMLGPSGSYEYYDPDIITSINMVFSELHQLGCGPTEGFLIENEIPKWSDYIDEPTLFGLIKSYVYFKVKLAFDPPSNPSVIDSMNRQISELEWRVDHAINYE